MNKTWFWFALWTESMKLDDLPFFKFGKSAAQVKGDWNQKHKDKAVRVTPAWYDEEGILRWA
jgi:hypothetical protein